MIDSTHDSLKTFNSVLFYVSTTAVLAPVAGITAAIADAVFAVMAIAIGTPEAKSLAQERFAHIPVDLVCAIPGVATLTWFMATITIMIVSKGTSANIWEFVHELS